MRVVKIIRKSDKIEDSANIINQILRACEPTAENIKGYSEAAGILKGIRFWDEAAKSKLREARLRLLASQYDSKKGQVKNIIDPLFRQLISGINKI